MTQVLHTGDLDLDVIVSPQKEINIVDENEFIENIEKYSYPVDVQNNAWKAVDALKQMVETAQIPFDW